MSIAKGKQSHITSNRINNIKVVARGTIVSDWPFLFEHMIYGMPAARQAMT